MVLCECRCFELIVKSATRVSLILFFISISLSRARVVFLRSIHRAGEFSLFLSLVFCLSASLCVCVRALRTMIQRRKDERAEENSRIDCTCYTFTFDNLEIVFLTLSLIVALGHGEKERTSARARERERERGEMALTNGS